MLQVAGWPGGAESGHWNWEGTSSSPGTLPMTGSSWLALGFHDKKASGPAVQEGGWQERPRRPTTKQPDSSCVKPGPDTMCRTSLSLSLTGTLTVRGLASVTGQETGHCHMRKQGVHILTQGPAVSTYWVPSMTLLFT